MLDLADATMHATSVAGCPLPVYRSGFDTLASRPHFADPRIAARAVAALRALPAHDSFRLLAWVLLPTRWHGLVAAASLDELRHGAMRIQGALAHALQDWETHRAPVWNEAIESEPIRDDRRLAECARAIVFDPVHAGLADRPGDYSFWDSVWIRGPLIRATSCRVTDPARSPTPAANSSCHPVVAS